MGVRAELSDFLTHLPAVDYRDERKALLTYTGPSELGIYLNWEGSNVEFTERLLGELSRRGQAMLSGFLAALPNAPQVANSLERQQQVVALRTQVDALDEAAFRAEFPVPLPVGAPAELPPADPAMLAAAVVNEVLAPYYKLGGDQLRQKAGERAVTLAERMAERVEQAFSGEVAAGVVLSGFKQNPEAGQVGMLQVLKAKLAGDPALAGKLAALFTSAAAEPEGGGLQALVDVSQEIGVVKGDVVGAVVGADVLKGIGAKIDVDQNIDTVEEGGTVVGAVIGGSGPINIGGQHHQGDVVNTGGGAYIGGGVQAGGDFVGRDKTVHGDEVRGDKITVGDVSHSAGIAIGHGAQAVGTGDVGTMVINMGSTPAPETPLIEEAIRLDVAHPPTAFVDDEFDLAVAVRRPDAPALTEKDLTEVSSEEGSVFRHEGDEVVLYRVAVSATGCDVVPSHYVLKLRPGANSQTFWFRITARRPGKRSIFVTAYQEDDALAAQTRLSIEVQVRVAPDG